MHRESGSALQRRCSKYGMKSSSSRVRTIASRGAPPGRVARTWSTASSSPSSACVRNWWRQNWRQKSAHCWREAGRGQGVERSLYVYEHTKVCWAVHELRGKQCFLDRDIGVLVGSKQSRGYV